MNDPDPFEDQLRRLLPAAPPEALQKRLLTIVMAACCRAEPAPARFAWLTSFFRPRLVAWIAAPVAALLVAAAFLWHAEHPARNGVPRAAAADFVPDSITLSQEVLARYDGGIVQSPDGEVVRLTCYDRVDRIILKDSSRGSVVECRQPQRQIVSVPLDVY